MVYYSKRMSLAEQDYDVGNKELLAIVATLEKWYIYVEGVVNTTIYTNYKNLLLFTTIKELNRRQVRWLKLLKYYKFTIKQVVGKDNK